VGPQRNTHPAKNCQDTGITSAKINKERENFAKRTKQKITELNQDMKNADREGQHMSRDSIKEQISELEGQLSNEAQRLYHFSTPLGSVAINLAWIDKYMYTLTEEQIQLVLSGLRTDMRNTLLNEALNAAGPKPVVAVAPIACMFGLNDARTDNVCIYDHTDIVGPDTLKQALARAGRSGKKNFIVAGHIDERLLKCFAGTMSTSVSAMDRMFTERATAAATRGGGGGVGRSADGGGGGGGGGGGDAPPAASSGDAAEGKADE
jgi:hypothetical protein